MQMGVDIIEAGFPISSNGDFECGAEIAKLVKNSVVCGLARAGFKDIDRAGEAIRPAKRGRIHTFISTSPVHMKHKLQMGPNAVLDAVGASVVRARNFTDDVQWSAEDATRTEKDFLCRCVELAIRSGATTINIPDTVGYTTPQEYVDLIRMLRERVPGGDTVIFSTHCHNDLGLAVANSLAGVIGGRPSGRMHDQRHGRTRGQCGARRNRDGAQGAPRCDAVPYRHRHDGCWRARPSSSRTSRDFRCSTTRPSSARMPSRMNRGIHQDGMLKNVETYEIMRPEDVGVKETSLVLGKLSGRHAFRDKLASLGYELSDEAIQDAFRRFKDLADKKKHVFDEDIMALVDDEILRGHDGIVVKGLKVETGVGVEPSAELMLSVGGEERRTRKTSGDGPVDAIFKAIRELYPHAAVLQLFQVHAVTEGTDAQATVSVRLEENGRTVTGRAADTDTLVAAANAYVNALNKLLVKRDKQAPEALTVAR